ncbi:hypothetical protein [Bradyrhizobium sp. CW4]|uniref:hypothetical protein n=1 Tax=Bradyrhizobium sp. CW4 TaxID=2782687 RepID=UPI0031FCA65A
MGTPGLEVQQMLTRVRAEVVSTTKSKQVPWSNSSLLGEVHLAGKTRGVFATGAKRRASYSVSSRPSAQLRTRPGRHRGCCAS